MDEWALGFALLELGRRRFCSLFGRRSSFFSSLWGDGRPKICVKVRAVVVLVLGLVLGLALASGSAVGVVGEEALGKLSLVLVLVGMGSAISLLGVM